MPSPHPSHDSIDVEDEDHCDLRYEESLSRPSHLGKFLCIMNVTEGRKCCLHVKALSSLHMHMASLLNGFICLG